MIDSADHCKGRRKVKRPKYLRIRESLLEKVRSGTLAPNEGLPKEADLAGSFGVAVGTLRHALRGLEAEGVVRRIPGQGTFINSPQQRRAEVRTKVFSLIVPFLREDPIAPLAEGGSTPIEAETAVVGL